MQAIIIRLKASLLGSPVFPVLLIMICADMLFGSLRAAREKKWNSAIGIDGGIRKVGMIFSVLLLQVVDMLIRINCIALTPTDMQSTLATAGLTKIGIAELFALLYILYEATSVLKNMLLSGIPVPRGIRKRLEKWLVTMTDETDVDMLATELLPTPAPEDIADPYDFLRDDTN